jgi:Leucine-rich repeat (LRR) protein
MALVGTSAVGTRTSTSWKPSVLLSLSLALAVTSMSVAGSSNGIAVKNVQLQLQPESVGVSTCFGDISQSAYEGLQALYTSMAGEYWKWDSFLTTSTVWTFPSNLSAPCVNRWQGLNCSQNDDTTPSCVVVGLNLDAMNLTGQIPTEIGNLDNMRTLDLSSNWISGSIPDQIELLTKLTSIELASNKISGVIPDALGRLSALVRVSLDDNYLTGRLPTEIALLSNLESFSAFANRINGTLPSEIGSLLRLATFNVEDNRLFREIPSELGLCTSLQTLILSGNYLWGTIPAELFNASRIDALLLNNNYLTGAIHSQVSKLAHVRQLWLQGNFLSGALSSVSWHFPNLQTLDLDDCFFTGSVPSELGELPSLLFLALNNNALTYTIPSQLASAANLQTLNLFSNLLTGSVPPAFGTFSNISTLSLSINYLTRSIPDQLCDAVTLVDMDVGFNLLSGRIPDCLGALTKMKFLLLELNAFSGTIPSQLGEMKDLLYLVMHHNSLTSTIPSELGAYSRILSLIVSVNSLTGSIPSSLFSMTTLEYMYLSGNSVSGSVPAAFGSLVNVVDLEISDTLFTGTLPAQIGMDLQLQYLELSSSYFYGLIPTALGSCEFLNIFSLGDNYFSGSFPSQLSQLYSLTQLNVSSNMLDGSIVPYVRSSQAIAAVTTTELMPTVESAASQQYIIQYVDVSKNHFTGSIPTYFLNSSSLTTVIMYSNCFMGSIPDPAICRPPNLQILVLDSLTSSPSCQLSLSSKKIVKGSFPRNLLGGSIPVCLWSMRKLTTMHLAGNGLQGFLGDIPFDSQLIDLSLSHNRLVGSVPLSIQQHGRFTQLDLSFNKLTHSLSETFAMNANSTNFDLSVNRLSSKIPTAVIQSVTSVDILQGNIFTCQEGNPETIPRADPQFEMYICGSSNYNRCLLLWLIICGGLLIVYFVSRVAIGGRRFGEGGASQFVYGKFIRYTTAFHILPKGLKARFTSDFLYLMRRFCILACVLSSGYVCICMMSFIVLKAGSPTMASLYSTYSSQYTWITSSAFLHGALPAALIVFYLLCTVLLMNWTFAYAYVIDYDKQRVFAYKKLTSQMLSASLMASTIGGKPLHGDTAGVLASESTVSESSVHLEPSGSMTLSISNIILGGPPSDCSAVSSDPAGVELDSHGYSSTYNKPKNGFCGGGSSSDSWWTYESLCRVAYTVTVQFLYAAITIVVNVGYVYVALSSNISPQSLDWIQFLLSIFKLWYNAMVKPWVIHRYLPFLNKSQQLLHMTFMSLFTFIAGPFIATFVTHSDCFLYAIFGEALITSSFSQPEVTCHSLCLSSVECIELCDKSLLKSITISTSIAPPWLYSYQCSSALLTNFLPVLILTFLLSGIVIPTFLYVVSLYRLQLRKNGSDDKAGVIVDSSSNGLGAPMLEPISSSSRNICSDNFVAKAVTVDQEQLSHEQCETTTSVISNPMASTASVTIPGAADGAVAGAGENGGHLGNGGDIEDVDVIGVPTLISKMILNAAVLMTYGLASPLLGVTVAIDGIIVSVFWRGYIENYCRTAYLAATQEKGRTVGDFSIMGINSRSTANCSKEPSVPGNSLVLGKKLLALEKSTATCGAGLRGSLTMVVVFLCVFWSLTMADMIGDVYGATVGGTCMLLTLLGLPVFHYFLLLWFNYTEQQNSQGAHRPTLTSIELLSLNVDVQTRKGVDVELANSEFT